MEVRSFQRLDASLDHGDDDNNEKIFSAVGGGEDDHVPGRDSDIKILQKVSTTTK